MHNTRVKNEGKRVEKNAVFSFTFSYRVAKGVINTKFHLLLLPPSFL